MKRWVAAAAVVGLVIYFQNCARSNMESDPNASFQANPSLEESASTLRPSEAIAIEFLNSYQLQVQTGLVKVLLADGSADEGKLYCIPPAKTAELENILRAVQICDGQDKSQEPDRLCQMDYRNPYAKLKFPNRDISLGESFSGCHQGADLCGEDAQKLKTFLSGVVSQLQTSGCHSESL